MSDVAIRVENLGKRYPLSRANGPAHYRTLREELQQAPGRMWSAFWQDSKAAEVFWALREVSFEVKPGEVLGVIGRNGAGKSTLLKILSRITEPTDGAVDLYGRVGSLLEVGTGFHPELTGRENIFLSGAMLGMRRAEVWQRFDEIVAFAGVERFIDQAVKHYSSGMFARLGFAVAAHLDTEILLVDEVLAVGDADFKQRCGVKVRQLAGDSGRAIIMVSHESAVIRSLCNRALLLKDGRVEKIGSPDESLQFYHDQASNDSGTIISTVAKLAPGVALEAVLVGGYDACKVVLPADQSTIDVEIRGRLHFAARIALELRLRDREGNVLALCSPGHDAGFVTKYPPGEFVIRRRIVLPRLLRGTYGLGLYLTDPNFTSWADMPDAVRLDVEGSTTRLGLLTSGAHCGWMLLDSIPLDENHGGKP